MIQYIYDMIEYIPHDTAIGTPTPTSNHLCTVNMADPQYLNIKKARRNSSYSNKGASLARGKDLTFKQHT